MGSFVSVLEGIVVGYFVALIVHFALGFLITREGRGILMQGDCLSRAYYMQLGLSWMLSGAAGAFAALHFLPTLPMGPVIVATVCSLLCLAILRTHRKASHLQTAGDSILMMLCLLVGCATVAYARLA